jgi:hypothetical protein
VSTQSPFDKRVYETAGEMNAVYSVGTVTVVECPVCHALVLWSRVEEHDKWHGQTERAA